MIRRLIVAALVGLLLAACSSDDSGAIKLDGSPRVPDDQGVATSAGRDKIVLDEKRTYKVSPSLQSFSTFTTETRPLATWVGQYVHIGLKGDTVTWIAGIAGVVPTKPPRVHYPGRLKEIDGDKAVFEDGTVLTLAPKVKPPVGQLTALIDPKTHKVVEVRTVAARSPGGG